MTRTHHNWNTRMALAALLALPLVTPTAATAAGMRSDFSHKLKQVESRDTQQMKAAPTNGDPDHDFAVKMMPHHQEAIDMARLELKYGKDPVFRKMARNIIQSQSEEIKKMQRRLKEIGH